MTQENPFDERIYLHLNPDVAKAVKDGLIESGLTHYQRHGAQEGRSSSRWSSQPHFIEDYTKLVNKLIQEHPESIDLAMAIAVGSPSLDSFRQIGDQQIHILQSHGLCDGVSIYDLGCGSGRSAQALNRSAWQGTYKGADVIKELIDYASDKQPYYEFVVRHDFSIDSPDGTLDIVFAWSVFTHLFPEETFLYLEDAYRALKAEGKVIFSFLEADQELHWIMFMNRVGQIAAGHRPSHLDYFFDRKMITKMAEKIGFSTCSFVNGDDPSATPLGAFGQSLAVLKK
jgi:SAM-dependent methyltransferase